MKLLYSEEEFCCTKAELLNYILTLPFLQLDIVEGTLESNSLIFSGDISCDVKPVFIIIII